MSRSVLVTGGAGFIGSRVVDALRREGHRVRVLDVLHSQVHGNQPRRATDLLCGDVADRAVWEEALEDIDSVIHFAAEVGVGQSMYEIERYARTNVVGTAVALEEIARRRNRIRRLLVASSMSIYGEGPGFCDRCNELRRVERNASDLVSKVWEPRCPRCGNELTRRPVAEEAALRPTSVYAITKRDQEELCLVTGRAYGIPTIALRFFNVYGPGQALENPYTGMVAIFGGRSLAGAPPLVFEDGRQTRDLIHVDDVVRACCLALDSDVEGVSLNIGTGRSTTVLEVAESLRRLLDGPPPQVLGTYRAGDIRHCVADVSAARRLLNWEPEMSFEDGIESLSHWLRNYSVDPKLQHHAVSELKAHGLVI